MKKRKAQQFVLELQKNKIISNFVDKHFKLQSPQKTLAVFVLY